MFVGINEHYMHYMNKSTISRVGAGCGVGGVEGVVAGGYEDAWASKVK